MTLSPDRLAELVAGYAADVKAIDPIELDLRDVLGYTDYFVIATGNTDRQTKAIHDRIHQGMKKEHGLLPRRVEGLARGALDPDGLPRRDRPHLHAGGARVLPARAALGRGSEARGGRVAALAVAGLAVGLAYAAIVLSSGHVDDRGFVAGLGLLVGWSFIGTGLFAWWRRPGNRTGLLMAAAGLAWFGVRPVGLGRRRAVHDRDRARRAVPRGARPPAGRVPDGPPADARRAPGGRSARTSP